LLKTDEKLKSLIAEMVATDKVMLDVRMQLFPVLTTLAESYTPEQQLEDCNRRLEERRGAGKGAKGFIRVAPDYDAVAPPTAAEIAESALKLIRR
jgi:hypothetical protein